jgi:CRISPR-associated protein (TIGR03986 family)
MIEGTILNYRDNRGVIKGDDDKTYDFNRKALGSGDVAQATQGRRVRFRPEGDRARDVTLLDQIVVVEAKPKPAAAPQAAPQKPGEVTPTTQASSAPRPDAATRPASGGAYRFLNPYNFVRWQRPPQAFDDADTQLLGRCAPPPHDRYIGLSGKIVCQLEAMSPLFISDSDLPEPSEDDRKAGHKTYRFFHYDFGEGDEPALPASSLRGMIRSVFEAVTNSCYAHFDYGSRLSYHLAAAESLKLVPGRVERDAQGRWQLRLLPGTARLVINDRPRDKLYAARVERYKALSPGRRQKGPSRPEEFRPVKLDGFKNGEKCLAVVRELQFPPVWNVIALGKDRNQLRPGAGERIIEGYLSINNQNIESKRFERFFFRDSRNTTGPELVPLPEDVRAKYADLLKDYQERHKDTIKKWREKKHEPDQPWVERDREGRITKKEAAFSRFIIGGPKEVQDGDLVYAMLSGSVQAPQVEFIVPVAVPRVGYNRKVAQLLPRHLHKCDDYNRLCPACRAFGWVYGHEDAPDLPIERRTAYASRIRIEAGRLIPEQRREPPTLPSTALTILSTPKPTTTRFYLKPSNSQPRIRMDDYQAGYDNQDNVLRGRKVYRHQGHSGDREYWASKEREYRALVKPDGKPEATDQNRTVENALLPGAIFEFTIRFANLSPVELGALLWTLEMNGAQYHRLGFGKPLGFGSVRLSIADLLVTDVGLRYESISGAGEKSVSSDERAKWLTQFKLAMGRAYEMDFDKLPHIKDLLVLLSDPRPDLPIHYPRTDVKPVEQGKNFEWFMGNNRNREARFVLEIPGEERGLPLIDKFGTVKL